MVVRQPGLVTLWKAAMLSIAVALAVAVVARLGSSVHGLAARLLLLMGGVAGYLAADLASGLVHWFCDSFFSTTTPLIGRLIIAPFREHHSDPAAITRCSFLEQDSTTYVLPIPLLAMALRGTTAGDLGPLAAGALLGFSLGSMGTNLFHKWAHAERVPAAVRWLQRWRLILSPAAHAVHHRHYDGGYCVTSGWMNALLDPVAALPRLERAVRRLMRSPRSPEPRT